MVHDRSVIPVLDSQKYWANSSQTRGRRFRLDRAVIGAYLTVSILHGLWDGLPGLLDAFLVPSADVLAVLAVVSATGLALLWWRWRVAVRMQLASVDQD